jgi:hypothetical protein
MIVRVELESYGKAAKELDDDGLELLKTCFPEAHRSGDYLYGVEGLVDFDQLSEIMNSTGLEAKIKPFKGNAFFSKKNGFEERLRSLEGDFRSIRKQLVEDGTMVQVHVPNLSLLSFNEVDVLENYCTNNLQKKLDEGWRIIAVCPPLDERRPTYIVGRYVPDATTTKIANNCKS